MIRQANIEDLDKLAILRVEHQKAEGEEEYDCDDKVLQNNAKKFFNKHLNNDYFCFIKEINNLSGKIGYVSNVYTKEKYRNKGIQNELMKECIDFLKSKNISVAELGTSNPIAIRLYKKFGFYHNKNYMKAKL